MKQMLITVLLALCCLSTATAKSLSGTTWIIVDDKTNKARAEVSFEEHSSTLHGRIHDIYMEPGDTGICSNCPGKFKDQPIMGMEFIWGLKRDGSKNWSGGEILDPKTGRIYHAKMLLKGDKLYVRGYYGISLLGRTQIWERKKT